jgi:hypothetical protein
MGGYSLIASERDTIRSFAESDDGALLVGTMSGVRRLVNGTPETYPGAGTPFPTHALLRDRDGSLWIGTPSFEHRPYPSGEKTGTPQRLDRRAAIPRSPGRIARICREFTAARCDLPRRESRFAPLWNRLSRSAADATARSTVLVDQRSAGPGAKPESV